MVAPIRVLIEGDAQNLNGVLKGASGNVGKFGSSIVNILPPSWQAVAKTAVGATKVIAKGTAEVSKAAKDAAAEEQIFADSMKAVTGSQDNWVAGTDAAIKASQKLAFTDTETRKAILSLSTATGDSEKSLELLTVAQDVARVSGVSLEQAADAVAKAAAGQDTALKRLLPGLGETASAEETIAKASNLAAGAAETFGQSSEAGALKADIAFNELKETLGAKVAPALKAVKDALKPLLQQLLELASKILPPVLNLLAKLFEIAGKVANAVNKIVDAVQRLIGKLKELLKPLDQAISKLKNLDLNPFNNAVAAAAGATQAAGVSTQAVGGGRGGGGGITINIYGDPATIEARVMRALKSYQYRNGPGAIFTAGRN